MLGTPAEATGRVTERVGKSWLNMASGMVANARFLGLALTGDVLARDRDLVQLELVEKLGFWSDVVVPVASIDHSKSLGLSDSELSFCDPLDDH